MIDYKEVKKRAADFSLTEVVADTAMNKEFKAGYTDYLNDVQNEKSFLWYSLSAIGQMVGETIYENVLNYIDNISNIDLCHVKALKSISHVLGITNRTMFDDLELFPIDVLNMMDVFSLNKRYLMDSNVINPSLVNDIRDEVFGKGNIYITKMNYLLNSAVANVSSDSKDSFKVNIAYDQTKYESYVTLAFYNLLKKKINIEYEPGDPVMSNLSNDLKSEAIYSFKAVDLDAPYREFIKYLQFNNNVTKFNPLKVADDIENNVDSIENYSGPKRMLIDKVFEYRSKQKFVRSNGDEPGYYLADRPLTKYSYYKEKELVDYLYFIEVQYINGAQNIYNLISSSTIYDLDNTYTEIHERGNVSNQTLLTDSPERDVILYTVAITLKDICMSIADIREKLKTQAQKNHMRGTFLLLSYVINQYLKKNLPLQYPQLKPVIESDGFQRYQNFNPISWNGQANVEIQEYWDTTEYYNLCVDTTQYAMNAKEVNAPFWLASDDDATGIGFSLSEIDKFYLSTLNLKSSTDETMKFLQVIYDIGADRSYIDRETSALIVTEDTDRNDLELLKHPELSTRYNEIKDYQAELFLKYSGLTIGYDPYFNWKNRTHSSYQIHPYLYKFVQKSNLQYSVKNAFYNDANKELMYLMMTPQISVHLGKVGNWLNLWRDNITDYSGYRSRYEDNTHNADTNYGMLSPLEHYDGVFYPSAIEEYVKCSADENKFAELIATVYNRWSGDYLQRAVRGNTFSQEQLDTILSDYVNYNLSLDTLSSKLSSEELLSALSPIQLELLSGQFMDLLVAGPKRTYYDKWYSHLQISESDSQYIAHQLSGFKSDILDLYQSRQLGTETYDIYKYCLDKYSNSLLLYKKYDLNSKYTDKQNAKGELWIRLNAHPIGFPAFGPSSKYPQVRLDAINMELLPYIDSMTDCRLKIFHDMDITDDYRYVMLAYGKNESDETYKDSSVLMLRPYMNPDRYSTNSEKYSERDLCYYQMRAVDDAGAKTHYQKEDGTAFQGFFQDNGKVDAIYTKFENPVLTVKTVQLPSDDPTGYKFKNGNSAGDKLTFTLDETTPGIFIETDFAEDAKFKVVYANNQYTVAFITQFQNTLSASTYIGMNSNFRPGDTDLASISARNYGRSHYDWNAAEVKDVYNSFDRFDCYLTLFDYSALDYSKTYFTKNYNLNPDASYIPLYSGLYGQIRVWATDYYRDKIEQSIHLLGYSHPGIPGFEDTISSLIYEDDDGNLTLEDPTAFLSTLCRVYEQYDSRKYFTHYETPVLRPILVGQTGDKVLEWTFDLLSNINQNTISSYYGIMYNIKRGARNPIAYGPLSSFKTDKMNEVMNYISAMTPFDEHFLSSRSLLSNNAIVVGTPDVFSDTFATNHSEVNTNSIFNISGLVMDMGWNAQKKCYQMSAFFKRLKSDEDFLIDRNDVTFMAFRKDCGEYEDYHMMYHHNTWPYLSNLTSAQMSVALSNFMTLDDVEVLSAGTIVFKINEETDGRFTKYPGRLIDDYLMNLLSSVNKSFVELSNVFDLSNTFIFELERPKKIADILGTLSIGIYSDTDECLRVYEDYLSDMYSVSKYENDFLPYCHFFTDLAIPDGYVQTNEDGPEPEDWLTENVKIDKVTDIGNNTINYYLNVENHQYDDSVELSASFERLCDPAIMGEHTISAKVDDVFPITLMDDEIEYKVTEADIENFLKLYVNFIREPDTGEITLFFNYNNLFCSPYVYRNKNGIFTTVFKPRTWLKLRSGESGTLVVEIQVRYFNSVGSVIGYKDIPVLAYKVFNVSDEDPKFVIINTWTISKENMKPVQGKPAENNSATLVIHDTVIDASNLSVLYDDFTLSADLTATANVEINSNTTVKNATCDFFYDYSDDDIQYLLEKSTGGRFVDRSGIVHTTTTNSNLWLAFRLKTGASIDDETLQKVIPIGALNFKAEDMNGVQIDNTSIIPGSIIFDFSNGNKDTMGRYLAKELGSPNAQGTITPFKGFILSENYKLVRIYQNKLISYFSFEKE